MPFERAAAVSLRLLAFGAAFRESQGESDLRAPDHLGIRGAGMAPPPIRARLLRKLGLKLVVGMQHCGRTALRDLETPKKAAVAWVFCFTQKALPITLTPRNEFRAVD